MLSVNDGVVRALAVAVFLLSHSTSPIPVAGSPVTVTVPRQVPAPAASRALLVGRLDATVGLLLPPSPSRTGAELIVSKKKSRQPPSLRHGSCTRDKQPQPPPPQLPYIGPAPMGHSTAVPSSSISVD
jgi:hypothetical protein